MSDEITIEYKRMLQRRGNKVDIGDLKHAELALVEDESSIYYGVNNNAIKLIGENSLEDSFDSNDNKKVLTANRGRELSIKIDNLQYFVEQYLNGIGDSLDLKQDIIVYKGVSSPSNTELIWLKTN